MTLPLIFENLFINSSYSRLLGMASQHGFESINFFYNLKITLNTDSDRSENKLRKGLYKKGICINTLSNFYALIIQSIQEGNKN